MLYPEGSAAPAARSDVEILEDRAISRWQHGEREGLLEFIEDGCRALWLSSRQVGGSRCLDGLCGAIARSVAPRWARPRAAKRCGRHAYLVTALYRDGGHTRFVEDCIAAHPRCEHHVVWTGADPPPAGELAEILRVVPASIVHHTPGSALTRLDAGLRLLRDLDPDIVVHVGHPNDPITIGLLEAPAAKRLMVHIADCSFALGRFVEATHVALGTAFASAPAVRSLRTRYLPLTCRAAFGGPATTIGPLVTATCGAAYKFEPLGGASYTDVLRARFAAREGFHVHVGALAEHQRAEIDALLAREGWSARFRHVEFASSVATTLHDAGVTLYLDSYPVGGGKAIVEAMAAGIPICAGTNPNLDGAAFAYPGCLRWRDADELRTVLQAANGSMLDAHARRSWSYFAQHHAFARFVARFDEIAGDCAERIARAR